MTEAGKLIIALGFEKMGLERIYACYDIENPASGKVMERLGMTYEGTLRKNRIHKKRDVDDVYYSILKQDYFS
ncbi:MAG: GNAT family protein [Carnobacterium inhibens]